MIIYALQDPRSTAVRYVGKTSNLGARYRVHISNSNLDLANTKKTCWIKSLKSKGFLPIPVVLDEVEDHLANEAEIAYIEFFGPENLTNGTLGGDGGAVSDPEARERTRQAHLGSSHTEETRHQMSESHKRRCESPEERKRMSDTAKAAGNTPPHRVGEANNAKLMEVDVRRIRSLMSEGFSPREIWKQEFQFVTYSTCWGVAKGKSWKHVE